MDEATLRFFEELPQAFTGMEPQWLLFHHINEKLETHLPLLRYYEVPVCEELGTTRWELRIGGKGE